MIREHRNVYNIIDKGKKWANNYFYTVSMEMSGYKMR